jgi:hypothetical protein
MCNKDKVIHLFIHSQALMVQDGLLASLFGVSVIPHIFRHTVGLLWTSCTKFIVGRLLYSSV